MALPNDVISRAGRLLYRELPEEYRYRDQQENARHQNHETSDKDDMADLEAYLHGFGHLLDLIRHTTEQAYADAFAEQADNGYSIQPWLVPYLANLVGAELESADPGRRMQELNNAVQWSKSKGTLRTIDQVSDTVAGLESVVREGWKSTLICPRASLPPFSLPKSEGANDPLGRTAKPLGCPNLRTQDRAVQDPDGANPLNRLIQPVRNTDGIKVPEGHTVFWKPLAQGGVPCFPSAYDDHTARCPDLRDPSIASVPGPHPQRNQIHLRPPDGYFEPGLKVVRISSATLNILSTDKDRLIGPREILDLDNDTGPLPDRLVVQLSEDLSLAPGAKIIFENLLFTGRVKTADQSERAVVIRVLPGAQLRMKYSAAENLELSGSSNKDTGSPPLRAHGSLFGQISGSQRFAELVYCTVTGLTNLKRLHASDCVLDSLGENLNCKDGQSCIRYSRFTPIAGKHDCFVSAAPSNTTIKARFVHRYLVDEFGRCRLRLARYGEPGYAVLDTATAMTISAGAEDEGEMGVYHHLFFASGRHALEKKVTAFLPLGQEIVLRYDPLLAQTPPRLASMDSD